jgi:hypothetical protein
MNNTIEMLIAACDAATDAWLDALTDAYRYEMHACGRARDDDPVFAAVCAAEEVMDDAEAALRAAEAALV